MLTRLLPRLYAALGAGRWLRNPLLERAYLAAFFAYKRFAEDPFAALVKTQPGLFRGGAVLDAGANAGYTATVFAGAIDPTDRVYAFEPEPVNARRLRGVVARRRLGDRIEVIESAVGDRSGEIDLIVNPTHPGDHRIGSGAGSIRVPLVSLDDYVEAHGIRPVKFVKIDVQGFELAVSQGMERLMAHTPRLAVAFEYSEETFQSFEYEGTELLRFYEDRGFHLYVLARSARLTPLTREGLADWERRHGYADVLAVRERLS